MPLAGDTAVQPEMDQHSDIQVKLENTTINGASFFKISNHDAMNPFFMSIVSDSNHWMFISSNGGLTAGRKDADNALFPYYTDDVITENYDRTGSKSIFRISKNGQEHLWEPFSERQLGTYSTTRNLYKNALGNKIRFEEINHDLEVSFTYQWSSSNLYGFVRESHLENHGSDDLTVNLLDGIQNIMPCGVNSAIQGIRSNLVDAYKRNELHTEVGLGIFALSAIIVDRAEPSEALKANTIWSLGLDSPTYLLSSTQLDTFRNGGLVTQEEDVKATKGSYFLNKVITLNAKSIQSWRMVANVNQNASDIAELAQEIKGGAGLLEKIEEDVALGSHRLKKLVGASDGFQSSADKQRDTRHYSNTLFNIMRGGIFDAGYTIEKWDFVKYLEQANKALAKSPHSALSGLTEEFSNHELKQVAIESGNQDFIRLAIEYMPLKFSRRHGDPSRPWNRFSINTRSEIDGSKILDYEGNWRDIFQNWEALAHAYPEFIESMIFKFLNASTFDGYNPYRVTKDGFDWEAIEPHDPWSYIGYWGDHQIIYLQKFLEFIEGHYPGRLVELFDQEVFVYANVPYVIKSYEDILNNPKDTIEFDDELDRKVRKDRDLVGGDGALLHNQGGEIQRANFIEKVLATSLSKLSNFIPEGGIWLNTQRPEWNDANNALVGNGVSMVTLYYLRRFFAFLLEVISSQEAKKVEIAEELKAFFSGINEALESNQDVLAGSVSDTDRKKILDGLGTAGSDFRSKIYSKGFTGKKESVELSELTAFSKLVLRYLEHSIDANRRDDGMYHAYNIMTCTSKEVRISYLEEMLEGQVSVLSSGYLSATQSLEVLNSMKSSKLFREDQYSYLLYPNKELKPFLKRNNVPAELVTSSTLLSKLVADGNKRIVEQDVDGQYHFNGNFKNANDLKAALETLDEKYGELVANDSVGALDAFDEVFNHKAFTGRSGTFYGYEGLGSIYWHMVSKLLLAVQEVCTKASNEGEPEAIVGQLLEHFYEINEGIGVHKSPELYGAFPIDPYSHTPTGKGAQQPGMTGQVKEDILTRIGELGVYVSNGEIHFDPCLLRANEFEKEPGQFSYLDLSGEEKSLPTYGDSLVFTYCQVPVVYQIAEKEKVEVKFTSGSTSLHPTLMLDQKVSKEIFRRSGSVESIKVSITKEHLK